MTGHVTALVALAGAVLLLGLLVSLALGRRQAVGSHRRAGTPAPAGAARRPSRAVPVRGPVPAPRPRRPPVRLAVAEPGARGPLFQYGGDGPGFEVDAPFAVVAIATTGFSPGQRRPDRRDRGRPRRRLRPGLRRVRDPRRPRPRRRPGVRARHLQQRGPRRADLRRHRRRDPRPARRRGRRDARRRVRGALPGRRVRPRRACELPLTPALCSPWLARRTLRTPDHTLRTLARHAGRTSPRHDVRARRRPHPGGPAAADAGRARRAAPLPLRAAADAGARRRRDPASRPVDGPREHRRLDGLAAGAPPAAGRRDRRDRCPALPRHGHRGAGRRPAARR